MNFTCSKLSTRSNTSKNGTGIKTSKRQAQAVEQRRSAAPKETLVRPTSGYSVKGRVCSGTPAAIRVNSQRNALPTFVSASGPIVMKLRLNLLT